MSEYDIITYAHITDACVCERGGTPHLQREAARHAHTHRLGALVSRLAAHRCDALGCRYPSDPMAVSCPPIFSLLSLSSKNLFNWHSWFRLSPQFNEEPRSLWVFLQPYWVIYGIGQGVDFKLPQDNWFESCRCVWSSDKRTVNPVAVVGLIPHLTNLWKDLSLLLWHINPQPTFQTLQKNVIA